MKYLKGIGGLGLVALGGFIGYHFSIGGVGNATLLGGILACILYYLIIKVGTRLQRRFWPGLADQQEHNGTDTIEQRVEMDAAVKKVQNMALDEYRTQQMRASGH